MSRFRRLISYVLILDLFLSPCVQASIISEYLSGVARSEHGRYRIVFPYGQYDDDLDDRVACEYPIEKDVYDSLKGNFGTGITPGGLLVKQIPIEDECDTVNVHNMQTLLREIWGERASHGGCELGYLVDIGPRSSTDAPSALERRVFFTLGRKSNPQPKFLKDYLLTQSLDTLNVEDIQTLLVASLLINPSAADGESFEVCNQQRVRSRNSFREIGVPFLQTRASCEDGVPPHYQLSTFNFLYAAIDLQERGMVGYRKPFEQFVRRPFEVKSAEEVLLNWMSWPLVRETLSVGGSERVSYLDHFIKVFRQFKTYLGEPGVKSIGEWIEQYQKVINEAYREPVTRKAKTSVIDSYDFLVGDPIFVSSDAYPSNVPGSLSVYKDFGFLGQVDGILLHEILFGRVLRSAASGNVVNRDTFKLVAERYMKRYPISRDLKTLKPTGLRRLSNEQKKQMMENLYDVLNGSGMSEDAIKLSILLGFDINQKRDGLTLLHRAVASACTEVDQTRKKTYLDKIRWFYTVPWLDGEALSDLIGLQLPETSLDIAVRKEDRMVFRELVFQKAGTKMRNPEQAHQWYLKLLSSNNVGDLRDSFRSLAKRNQKLGWQVVLQEVFPKVQAAQQGVAVTHSVDEMVKALISSLDGSLNVAEKKVCETFLELYRGGSKTFLLDFLINTVRSKGYIIDPPQSDPLEASVMIGLESDVELNGRIKDRIDDRLKRILGVEFKKYQSYQRSDDDKHLADTLALRCINTARIGASSSLLPMGSMSAFYALPLLVGYLEREYEKKAKEEKGAWIGRNENVKSSSQLYWEHFKRGSEMSSNRADAQIVLSLQAEFMKHLRELQQAGDDREKSFLIQEAYEQVVKPLRTVESAENGTRVIPSEIRAHLWSGGRFKRANEHGRCNVQKIGLGADSLLGEDGILYVKQYPQSPGLEAAVNKFLLPLIGSAVPYSDLFNIDGVPYLVSQGFNADNLLAQRNRDRSALEEKLRRLNPVHFSKIILGNILVSPEDGKLDNHVILPLPDDPQSFQVVSIDNDHPFVDVEGSEKLQEAAGYTEKVETRSCLFAMKKMNEPIPDEVRNLFSEVSRGHFMEQWLREMQALDAAYDRLFPDASERLLLWKRHQSCVSIVLTKRMVQRVNDRFVELQTALSPDSLIDTHAELLGYITPTLADRKKYFWRKAATDFEFLGDKKVENIPSSTGKDYYTSHGVSVDNSIAEPIEKRLTSVARVLLSIGETIKNVEVALEKKKRGEQLTSDDLEAFREWSYQQRRLLRGTSWRIIGDPSHLIQVLLDPSNPPRWLEFQDCELLRDTHFSQVPDGDSKQCFPLSSLRHLSVSGCSNLTPRLLSLIKQSSRNLVYLDISCTPIDGESIDISLSKLKTVKMNGMRGAALKSVKVTSPVLEEFECNGADQLKEVVLEGSTNITRISLINDAQITDDILDALLFVKAMEDQKDNEQNLLYKKGDLIAKYKNLFFLHLKGTSVTWPELRESIPGVTTEKIKETKNRLDTLDTKDSEEILRTARVNTDGILGVGDFFLHAGHFLKNTLGGICWDIWGVVTAIKRLVKPDPIASPLHEYLSATDKERSLSKEAAVYGTYSLGGLGGTITGGIGVGQAILSSTSLAVDVAKATLVATDATKVAFMAAQGGTAAASTVSTAVSAATIATGVGAVVSGVLWMGRAAYWEHQRVKQQIDLTRIIMGKTLRAAVNTLKSEEIDLSSRHFGDSGILHFLRVVDQDRAAYNFGSMTDVNFRDNDLTDVGGGIILSALQQSPKMLHLDLSKNKINDNTLLEIQKCLNKHRHDARLRERDKDSRSVVQVKKLDRFGDNNTVIPRQPARYFGLSIDGGGMRGLIPTVILREFLTSARVYKPGIMLHEIFDCIGGTSIGGIGALSLALPSGDTMGGDKPREPERLVKFFYKRGYKIFGKRTGYGVFGSKYAAEPLEGELKDLFREKKLSDALAHVVVTGVRTDLPTGLEPLIFDSRWASRCDEDNYLARDVGRGTSSAPPFFPQASMRDLSGYRNLYSVWDGGVWKNNPSDLVFNRILEENEGASRQNTYIFSLGTGRGTVKYSPVSYNGLYGNCRQLVFGQLDLSREGVSHTMSHHLGDNYRRIQPILRDDKGKLLSASMDDYSPATLQQYEALAQVEWINWKRSHDDEVRQIVEMAVSRREEGGRVHQNRTIQ